MTDVRQNYDAVNEAIMHEQRKSYELLRFQRASKWELYGNVAIKFGCAASVVILALALGWWLLSDQSDTIYNTTYTSIDSDTKTTLEELADNSPVEVVGGGKIETEFTVFHSVDHGEFHVVTGWQYMPTDLDSPYSQYCYWSVSNEGFKEASVYLATMDNSREILWNPVEEQYARHAGDCHFKTDF